jgi:hypothetical protein
VTVLAILAGVLAVLAGIHVLQSLAILPYFIGPFAVRTFSLWYAIMWGMMVWVYAWLVKMLWEVDPQAWLFLVMITIFNLVMNFFVMLSATVTWSDVSVSFLINALILIYCMLPGARRAFGVS